MNVAVPPPPPPPPQDALPVRIGPFDRIIMGGIPYGNAKRIGAGYSLSRLDVSPPLAETFSKERLEQERGKAGYSFDRNWFASEKAATRELTSIERLADLADDELPKVMWRLEWVTRFLKRELEGTTARSDEALDAVIPKIQAEIIQLDIAKTRAPDAKNKRRAGSETVNRGPPCAKSLLNWTLNYEEAGLDPCALRYNKRKSGNRTRNSGACNRRIDVKIAVLMWKHAIRYASLNRPKKKHLHKDLCDEIDLLPENAAAVAANAVKSAEPTPLPLPHPSRKAFSNVIKKLDKYDVFAGRYGVLAAKRKFAMVAAGLDVVRPGQRIEIDEWQVSLMVLLVDAGLWEFLSPQQQAEVERVRMWMCAAIDCATRCILGMRLARTASSANAVAVLRMIVNDKSGYAAAAGAMTLWDMRCSPETVASDSGSSFIADVTQSAIIDLTGSPKIPPVDLVHHRARIERLFGTVHTALISRLHGRTFENTVELGDYNPQAMANLNVDELACVLVRFVVDAYHNMPHAGLGGETPRNAWLRLTKLFHVVEPPDRNKMRAIFGIKLKPTLRAGGVHVMGLAYNSELLEAHRRRVGDGVELDARIDTEDVGFVSVRLGENWLTVPCVHHGFERITVKVWIATLADLRLRFAREAKIAEPVVRAAVRAIQQLAAAAEARAGIAAHLDTTEDIERAERDLAISFTWAKPDPEISSTGGGLFANVFPAGGETPPPVPAAEPTPDCAQPTAAPVRRHRMED